MDGWMYPLASCSSMKSSSALSSTWFIGYTLQLRWSGASFLRSIAWSQERDRGKCSASCSLKTDAKSRYSSGRMTTAFSSFAAIARSVAAPRVLGSGSSTIRSFSSVVSACAWTSCRWMLVSITSWYCLSRAPCFQLNFGSYSSNQGYPSITSSCLMSAIKNHISLCH